MKMARESVNKRVCFVCLNSIELCHQKELSNNSHASAELFVEFIKFASGYLKLPVNLKNKGDYCDGAFCEPCGIRVEIVFELYSELRNVELRLSSKLEELGKLMKESSMKQGSSNKEETLRSFVVNKCLQKFEEIQENATLESDLSAQVWDEEMEENEIKLEVEAIMSEEDEPDPLQSSQYIPEPSSSRSVPNSEYSETAWNRVTEQDGKLNSDICGNNEEPMSVSGESERNNEDSDDSLSEPANSHNSNVSESDFERSEETGDDSVEERPMRRSPRRPLKKPLRQVMKKRIRRPSKDASQFTCLQCDKRCCTALNLYKHLLEHEKQSDNKGKSCCFCNKRFIYEQTQYLHMKRFHKPIFDLEKPYICDDTECSSSFSTVAELNEHLKEHSSSSSQPILYCSICEWGFLGNNHENLEIHELVHKTRSDGVYQCPFCDSASFRNVNMLQKHYRKTHSKNLGAFKCHICQKSHPNEKILYNHILKHHEKNSENGKPCWFCYQSFSSEMIRDLHVKLFHKSIISNAKPFACDEKNCEEKFTSTEELNEHLQQHSTSSSQPILYCSVCRWGFKNQDFLNLHSLVHTVRKGSKGYQ